jgi:hypothetical protein
MYVENQPGSGRGRIANRPERSWPMRSRTSRRTRVVADVGHRSEAQFLTASHVAHRDQQDGSDIHNLAPEWLT